MLPQKLAFVDTETTGLSVTHDKIIEIGIVRVEEGRITKKYQTLLDPGFIFPDVITSITGITPRELENAPTFRQVKDEILEMLQDCMFVAHNVRFDYAFLKNEFKREGVTFSSKHFCTARLSRSIFPKEFGHSLDKIIERFDITCEKRHRAFDDAYVLWEFYQKLQKTIPTAVLEKHIVSALKRPSRPLQLAEDVLEKLPELPGVYIFYGHKGAPLYVGKSINIKERVLSHFSQDYLSTKDMQIAQQITSIQTHVTSGELGALLKEGVLIKTLQPLYNRMLRQSRKVIILQKKINLDGYMQVVQEETMGIDPAMLASIIGVFKSKRQAKEFLLNSCKKHQLCEKLLGLEKSKGACFSKQLGTCNGACVRAENPLKYNIRFLEAFSKNSLKKWPFDSPIAIKEEDILEQTTEYFVIDKWCILGSFVKNEENTLRENVHSYTFDVDTYKILLSYISKRHNWKNIYHISLDDSHLAPLSEQ